MSPLRACTSLAQRHPWSATLLGTVAVALIAGFGFLKPLIALAIAAAAVAVLRAVVGAQGPGAPDRPAASPAVPSAHRARSASRTVMLVFGAPGALVAAIGLALVVHQERTLANVRIVPATVVGTAPADPRSGVRGGVRYRPAVRHRYTVDGRTFESDRLYPRSEHRDLRQVEALLAMYRPGQRVFTRVPADDPRGAFLAPRRIWIGHGLLAFGLVIVVAVALARRWLRGPASAASRMSPVRSVVQR